MSGPIFLKNFRVPKSLSYRIRIACGTCASDYLSQLNLSEICSRHLAEEGCQLAILSMVVCFLERFELLQQQHQGLIRVQCYSMDATASHLLKILTQLILFFYKLIFLPSIKLIPYS